jgi:hypothetical protein
VYAVTQHKEIDMRTTLSRIIVAVLAVLAVAAATVLTTPFTSAGATHHTEPLEWSQTPWW